MTPDATSDVAPELWRCRHHLLRLLVLGLRPDQVTVFDGAVLVESRA